LIPHTSSPPLLLLLGEGRQTKKKQFPLSLVKERRLGGEVETIAIYPLNLTLNFTYL